MKFALAILAAFALLLAGCAGSAQQPAGVPAASGNNATTAVPPSPAGITLAALAAHNTVSDCWMAISGSVYDLSSFSSHPGGEAYVPYCGTDATVAFDTKGGRGRPHSSAAVAMLPRFKIGAFAG